MIGGGGGRRRRGLEATWRRDNAGEGACYALRPRSAGRAKGSAQGEGKGPLRIPDIIHGGDGAYSQRA
eukprot:1600571-Pyramimonas_sp.AAC.1